MPSHFTRLIVSAAALGAVVVAGCSSPAPAARAPEGTGGTPGGLVARTATVDLGRVPFDVQAEGRFELVNTSARPVKLTAPPQVKMLEGC